jgi:hypothetical protein
MSMEPQWNFGGAICGSNIFLIRYLLVIRQGNT